MANQLLQSKYNFILQRQALIVLHMKTLTPSKKDKEQKTIIGLDLGSSWIRIVNDVKQFIIQNSLFIQNGNVYLNKKTNTSCLIDIVSLLGQKHKDPAFQENIKYYDLVFKKGINTNILVQSKYPALGEEFYLEMLLTLLLRGIFQTNTVLRYFLNSLKPIKVVSTVFEGKLNPYRHSLAECLSLAGISEYRFVNTSACIASQYLNSSKKDIDDTQVLGVIDFGAQGLTFSIFKLYTTEPRIVETLSHEISYFGGIKLTHLLVDYIVSHLIKEKGMDISRDSFLMNKLKLLCNQGKHILSTHEKAFVRLDGLPDIIVFGMQVSVKQFETHIYKYIEKNIDLIAKSMTSAHEKVNKVILAGGSSKIPLFLYLLNQTLPGVQFIDSDAEFIQRGLTCVQSDKIKVLQVYPFDIKMEGDEKAFAHLVKKGESVPLRKKLNLTFPSGELTFSLKFYQNDSLVATVFIPERPRENKFSLFLQIDHNKLLNIFATTSQGLIKMTCNMIQIPREECIRYGSTLDKLDFHMEND